jgi:hypothetical protein
MRKQDLVRLCCHGNQNGGAKVTFNCIHGVTRSNGFVPRTASCTSDGRGVTIDCQLRCHPSLTEVLWSLIYYSVWFAIWAAWCHDNVLTETQGGSSALVKSNKTISHDPPWKSSDPRRDGKLICLFVGFACNQISKEALTSDPGAVQHLLWVINQS